MFKPWHRHKQQKDLGEVVHGAPGAGFPGSVSHPGAGGEPRPRCRAALRRAAMRAAGRNPPGAVGTAWVPPQTQTWGLRKSCWSTLGPSLPLTFPYLARKRARLRRDSALISHRAQIAASRRLAGITDRNLKKKMKSTATNSPC